MMIKKLEDVAVVMNYLDQVALAKTDLRKGEALRRQSGYIQLKNFIPKGERFALRDIKKGEYIKQYGFPFCRSKGIRQGELITRAKVINSIPAYNLNKYRAPAKTVYKQEYLNKKFLGIKRTGGKFGTRNYFIVVPTSMCASEVCLQAACALDTQSILAEYPNIDGIVAIAHTEGCGCDSGTQIDRLLRVLKGYCSHPNVGGCLIVDLGCEQTNYERVNKYFKDILKKKLKPIDWLTIQESGGAHASLEKAKKIITKRLSQVNKVKREYCSISNLIVGTECGASDSFSGITANPVIGNAVDKIIQAGGKAILTEVTEMLGTFNMLFGRFRSKVIARKFLGLIKWYEDLAAKMGLTLAPNLVPKNIEGGLINNYIKSLGAVMKGGTTAIEDVIDYAQALKKKGLTIMQGPGNDPESVTGLVASGTNLICFSTGKGTVTADAICPVIKISSNEITFKKLPQDMDFDASRLLSADITLDALGEELLNKIIAVASGEKTWSEKWKQRQFQVWTAGKLSL